MKLLLLSFVVFNCFHIQAQTLDEQALTDTTNFKITLLPFNSPDNDYHAVPYRSGIVFSSSRNANWGIVYESTTGNKFTDLFFTHPDVNGIWSKPKAISKAINSKLNEGPFCFNDSGNVIYFTTNKDWGAKDFSIKTKLNHLKIFKAELVNGKWTNLEPFIFNNSNFSVGHPSLSKDGKRLFFVSDMPGGFGGSDIYETFFMHGQWSKPINLGNKINTKGNESFPFIARDGTLYFSSNGHTGLGKLDIYSAEFINSEWKNVKNLEAPLNSAADDFSYMPDSSNSTGYFSSNRLNETEDNIYQFQSFKTPCDSLHEINKCFTFFEKATIEKENTPLVYEWDLGDGTKHRGLEVTHCYAHEGEFKISLNIIDSLTKNIFFNEASYVINIDEVSTPYFEIDETLYINKLIEFDGRKSKLSKAKIRELIWDFGDGVKSIGPKVYHTYLQKGTYQVSLEAQGIDTLNNEIEQCIFKIIHVIDTSTVIVEQPDSAKKIEDVAKKIFSIDKAENITYAIQVTSSEIPIPVTSDQFKGLSKVSEYEDNGIYGYTVGQGNTLEEMYPLYNDVKIKGFDEAQVVAFKNKKLLSQKDSSKRALLNGKSYTHISGRVMTRFGDPLSAVVVLENLSTGKVISSHRNDSEMGKYLLELPNGEIYGYYAERDSFYSASNFIDLRNEKRNLEVKKNIEMILYSDLDEENLSLRINNLFFGTNKYNISPESFPELRRLVTLIKKSPKMKIEISGHSDNMGTEESNLLLSQRRADAVKAYLIESGCPSERITSKGYGFSIPLVSNNTERGRYLNRRVEIKFLNND